MSRSDADPLAYLDAEIDDLRAKTLYRPLRVMSGPQAPRTTMDGRPVISLSSNNYLGLATHPHLVEAALAAVRELGVGIGRRAHDRRHDGAARGARAAPGGLQARRGDADASSPASRPTAASSRPSPASAT